MSGPRLRPLRAATILALCLMLGGAGAAERLPADACLRGVNLAGAEFGRLPGVPNRDYAYPSPETIGYFARTGMTVIRLPFRWPRLQPELNRPFDKDELARLETAVRTIRDEGLVVVLDPHDYAHRDEKPIGSAEVPVGAFAEFWSRLATRFAGDPGVVFGLMNEPYGITARQWLPSANAAIAAIRKTGAKNLVLVPGTSWTGAHSWFAEMDGGSNATVMAEIVDPADHFAYDVHQYLDKDFSGTTPDCSRGPDAAAAIDRLSDWLKASKRRAFLGEFGASRDKECLAALKTLVARVDARPEAWVGWSYWAAGDWWDKTYMFSMQPVGPVDRPQLTTLLPTLRLPDGAPARCPR
ncbi:glycoside hydrolase family 5 protein [Methyloraptor flagellatus]|uniref:Glycoside hydrolase family 5 protein n=1 Tax=Methyloraptor flagellatus TaxID=3162530 RepID=A0AAU7X5Q5_9HYPH